MKKLFKGKNKHIGFISTRLAGSDGVSLETKKWAEVLEKGGFKCFFFGGELDYPKERSYLVKEAHFNHPEIRSINKQSFGKNKRSKSLTKKIYKIKDKLKSKLYHFISKYSIDIIIAENSLSIPVNIPLGIALTELISETSIPTIAHNHDFFWERKRFLRNSVWEFLNMAFPPHLPSIQHVVINSSAQNQLSLRKGISSVIIPNVMNFEKPYKKNSHTKYLRDELGIDKDEVFILQPTRIVPRKGIEHTIELAARLGLKSKVVITHNEIDEGKAYKKRVLEYAHLLNVDIIMASNMISKSRTTDNNNKKYTLWDFYSECDLVSYPSTIEGFGNAFLEAVYFKKPIVVNDYSIFFTDIKPKGFEVIEFDNYITESVIKKTREVLSSKHLVKKMTEKNYEIGKRYYSYKTLKHKLINLILNIRGINY